LQKAFTQRKSSVGRSVLEMPVLDAFENVELPLMLTRLDRTLGR